MFSNVAESFSNNLIVEDRYRMILDGLQVTLLITFCAAVLGTILGGLVCWSSRAHSLPDGDRNDQLFGLRPSDVLTDGRQKKRTDIAVSPLFIINPCILPQANQISNKQRHKGN